jgi:hypothetical protein
MTPEEARAYVARWKLVNDFEREELRATPIPVKFRQLEALMLSARALHWTQTLAEDDWEEHERWIELRRKWNTRRPCRDASGNAAGKRRDPEEFLSC